MPHHARTIPELLDLRAHDAVEQGIVFPDARETYPQLAVSSRELAATLWSLGVRHGDRVGLLLHGCLDSVRFWLAAARIGAVAVPMNVRLKPRELAFQIEHSDMRVLITQAEFGDALHDALPGLAAATPGRLDLPTAPDLRVAVTLGDAAPPAGFVSAADVADGARGVDPAELDAAGRAVAADDPILLLYTSGTTARPRGCVHSHASLVVEGEAVAERLGLRPDDRFWAPLPMFHSGGFDVLIAALAGRCGMVHVGTFDAGRALRQLEDERCTIAFPAFDTIWVPVLEHPDFASTDLSALRLVINVGAPERMRSMQAQLPHAVQVSCTGMTESFGFCCLGAPDDPADIRATTCGRPLRHMEVEVGDLDTGRPCPPGVPGSFRFRGGSRMMHYHRDPEATASRIDAAGWFTSDDLIVADDAGRVSFLSRRGDMLKVGGENVAAAEVEGFLSDHPAVSIVQVIGATDARYGEVVAAFVQLKDGVRATAEDLAGYCVGSIASFKIPRHIRFVRSADDWPMSGTKVQKFVLRQWLDAELAALGITAAPPITAASPR